MIICAKKHMDGRTLKEYIIGDVLHRDSYQLLMVSPNNSKYFPFTKQEYEHGTPDWYGTFGPKGSMNNQTNSFSIFLRMYLAQNITRQQWLK